MNFSIVNLGCKVNAYEAEAVADLMEHRGWKRVDASMPADACIVFTCTVTSTASAKSRHVMRHAKRLNPSCVVAAAGCYVQTASEELNEVEILVGSSHKKEIPDLIDDYIKHGKKIRVSDIQNGFQTLLPDHFEHQTRAYLKIQDGCSQFCSYCIIPYARGRECSMDPDAAVAEAARLSKHYHEIVLTGIHTGRYGREYGIRLSDLMARILKEVPDILRLRLSSIEVTEIDDALLQIIASNPRAAHYLHIPLQSGSDTVLRRMNRPYNTSYYYDKIEKIRRMIPDISISADVIAGFPGETEDEFKESMEFIRKCGLSFLHVFPYSQRKGTKAAAMPDQIDPMVKKRRTAELSALSETMYDSYKSKWVGSTVEVLMEKAECDWTPGHTSQYLPVKTAGILERGSIQQVHIVKLENHQLYAERGIQ